MEELDLCRVCLTDDARMCLIANTHLQEMYESLTLMPLETKDNRPVQVCYICYAGLQNCYRLKKRCLQSEKLLTQVLNSDVLVSIIIPEISTRRLKVVHPVVHLSMGDEIRKGTDDESIEDCDKIEPPDLVDNDVKDEEDDEKEENNEGLEEHDIKIEDTDELSDHDPVDVLPYVITTKPDNVTIEEDIDVVSLGTEQPLPTTQTHVRTNLLPSVPSAQKHQHIQRTVETATTPSVRPAARKRLVPPPNIANASRRRTHGSGRRSRRSYTDLESEAESPETDRRSIHKDMERLRRTGHKNLFDELKKQIPATRDKERAAKVVILREAAALCRKLSHEDLEREKLREEQNQLVAKLKQLRTMLSLSY